jgi:uncharacterized protein (DUF952 family)
MKNQVVAMEIYKILTAQQWASLQLEGVFRGSPVDLNDGYIHFSTGSQVAETAHKHFKGQSDLMLAVVDDASFGDALRYEPSRGGQLFPHLFGSLPLNMVERANPLPMDSDGFHSFEGLLP